MFKVTVQARNIIASVQLKLMSILKLINIFLIFLLYSWNMN